MEKKAELYRKLAGCAVYVPVQQTASGINIQILKSLEGKTCIPVFYSKDANTGFIKAERLAEVPFVQLRNAFIDMGNDIDGIVIEPFTENIALGREDLAEFDAFTKGMSVKKAPDMGRTGYANPPALPEGMKAALSSFCENQIGINRLWVLLAKGEMEKQAHKCVMVDFIGSKVQLFPMIADEVKKYMMPGEQFEIKPLVKGLDMGHFRDGLIYERRISEKA